MSFLKAVHNLCVLTERLCRNTALIQACTPYRTGLDKHDLHSPSCCKQSRFISTGPCTDYDYLHDTQIIEY